MSLRRFKELAQGLISGRAVWCAVQLRAERHGLKVGLPRKYEPPQDLIPRNVLDNDARDLPEMLRQLDTKPPKSREDQWLDNRSMLNTLIEGLRTQRDPITGDQCNGWPRCSPLAKITEIQILNRPLKSRLRTALEVVAEIGSDSAEHILVRVVAKSVLVKDKFVLQLWKSRTEYVPLVYELLLAIDKRLCSTQPTTRQTDWYVSG